MKETGMRGRPTEGKEVKVHLQKIRRMLDIDEEYHNFAKGQVEVFIASKITEH